MDHELVLHEEECVTLCCPWIVYHVLHFFRCQLGQVVHDFPRVLAARNTESEIKFKALDALVFEIVALDHDHARHRLISDRELDFETYCLEVQEVWSEVVLD